MPQTRDLIVRLGVDDAKLDQGLDAAERRVRQNISAVNKELDRQRRVYRQSNQAQNAYYREMEQAETKRARQLQESRAKYAAIGVAGAAAGVKIAQGVSVAIHAASDMNETASKSNVVFGKFAGTVTQAFADSATAIGQSKQQATEAAATLGNLFVSMGIGQRKAADMSVSMVKLASDMASFNNASPQETLEAIRAGLVGETEPLRRFGVNLNDAALRAEAMRLGLGKIGATLTPLQRSQAAYSLILQQTKTAQGDFARTAGGMANQERILAARQADLNASMGKVFLPIASEVLGVVNKLPLPLAAVVGGIGKAGPAALGALPGLLSYVSTMKAVNAATDGATASTLRFRNALSVTALARGASNPVVLTLLAMTAAAVGLVKGVEASEKSIKKQSDTLAGTIIRFADGAAASDDLRRAMDSIRLSAMPTADELGALQVRSAGLDQALASLAKSGHAIDAAYVFNQIAQKASDAHISEAQLTSIFPQYTSAARTANTATSGLATASDNAAGAAKRQRDALATPGGLIDALQKLNTTSNANALSELDWRDKLVQVTQTIKDNKGALSKKTQAGRDDRRAVIEAANAVLQHTAELKDQKAPLATINSYLGTHRQQLINAAIQAGLTKREATRLINEYLKIPAKRSTEIVQPGMRKSLVDALGLRNRLFDIPKRVTTTVDVRLRAQMAVVGKVGQARQGPGNFAKGGMAPAGWALVGEEGPELVRFTDTARVYTASQTRQALADVDRLGLDAAGFAKRIGFAGGGIASVQSYLRSTDPLPYRLGGVGPGSYDCSGLVGEAWARLTGHPSFRRYFTTANMRRFFAPGFVPGGLNVGLRPNVHTAGNLAGLRFEAANPRAGIRIGSAATPLSSFPVQLHLAGLQALSQAQMLQALRQVAPVMLSRYSKYVRTGHFDQGGTLPPGMTLAYNGTGRGETVLPNGRIRLDRADMQYLASEIARSLPLGESAGHAATRYGRGG